MRSEKETDKKPGACGASFAIPAARTAASSRTAQMSEPIRGGARSWPARSRSARRSLALVSCGAKKLARSIGGGACFGKKPPARARRSPRAARARNRSPARATSECPRGEGKRDFGAPRTLLVVGEVGAGKSNRPTSRRRLRCTSRRRRRSESGTAGNGRCTFFVRHRDCLPVHITKG